MHRVKLRAAGGWSVADLDQHRCAIVLELLKSNIISFVHSS